MNIKLDENGITIATLPELIETLIAEFKTIYGSDINLSQDTLTGSALPFIAGLPTNVWCW
ncbi:hypothetical protein QE193_23935 (plasmid) [Arsenophonus nasoniae]|uniref:hypothetical protein n=1 Tax=Arsenophonus nasoniae TaxID=638 RepID=UPI002469B8FB|nr:hypothetical protein [Arsenophonus nasoniae]WGM18252.1 hypothetical protein QE193_23935 [Arsenophonus nasoniae]